MYTDPNHPGLAIYRAARAERTKVAILKNKIREANPEYTEAQVQNIADASMRAAGREVNPRVKRGDRRRRKKETKTRKVEVQVVNKLK